MVNVLMVSVICCDGDLPKATVVKLIRMMNVTAVVTRAIQTVTKCRSIRESRPSRCHFSAHGLPFEVLCGTPLVKEIVQVLFRLFPLQAITFLQLSDHLLGITLDLRQIVVGEFAPLAAYVALHLVPSAF